MGKQEEYIRGKKDEFRWFFDKAIGILDELGNCEPWAAIVLCGQSFDILGKKFKQLVAQDATKREPGTVKERVRISLLKKGISAASIARHAGVSRSAITHTMRGEIKSKKLRAAIAAAIGVEVEDLWPSNGNGHK